MLVERKLDGRVIKLSNLGQTNGILIRNVPEEVSDEFLELYFQSPRSGGHDDVVADVKIVDNSNGRMAVVVIDDVTGNIKSIFTGARLLDSIYHIQIRIIYNILTYYL